MDVDPSTSKKSHDKSSFGCEDLREWKKNDVGKNQKTLIEEPAMWHLQPINSWEVVASPTSPILHVKFERSTSGIVGIL